MRRSFLSKLHRNGAYYIVGALLLLLGVPLYQLLVLLPQGYTSVSSSPNGSHFLLLWISAHLLQFLGYRVLLILAFAFLFTFPFTLFRIIVAQEILGGEEEGEGAVESGEAAESEEEHIEGGEARKKNNGMPAFAWRGQGYAVIAAWAGISGIVVTILGILTSTLYLSFITSSGGGAINQPPTVFNIITNTVGGGLLAIACLFFGAVITRRGSNLWPRIWVLFGYVGLALALLLSASAVEGAISAPNGQEYLTTPAILILALWMLWFGIMLVRLKPEAA